MIHTLEKELPRYVDKDLFISCDVMRAENEKLWPRVWLLACREEQVPSEGDWYKYNIADQSVLVVRQSDGELKAFHNVCLHRGSPLKSGCSGNSQELRCRYHGWRWSLDGQLREVTDAHDFDPQCIASDRLTLSECRVETWAGWVFINMDLEAISLIEYLGPIVEAMARYEVDEMRAVRHRSTVLRANWKTVMHAFTDGYHTQGTHPQLLKYYDDTGWEYRQFGIHGQFTVPQGKTGRSSPRLRNYNPDKKEILHSLLGDMGAEGIDIMTEEQVRLLKAAIDQIPEGVSVTQFVANMRKQELAAISGYLERFGDDEMLGGGVPDWAIFPNVTTPMAATTAMWLAYKPYGNDPEMCELEVWSLERQASDIAVEKVIREEYPDYREHKEWGRVLMQDMENCENVQRGMHSRGFSQLICGRQDSNLSNHIRALQTYIGR